MLSRLESVFTDSAAPFAATSIQERPLATDIAHCERDLGSGTLTLRNRCIDISWGYQLRLVHLRSPKIEIVTAFAFPRGDRRLPLYGMEVVALGRRPVVGVLDLLDLHPASTLPPLAEPILREAHEAFPDLPYSNDQPAWFEQCRSGQDFFLRPDDLDTLLELVDVHHHVMGRLAALGSSPDSVSAAADHDAAISHYKRHHRDNSPGLPLLHRVFGEPWTSDYLDGYLFA